MRLAACSLLVLVACNTGGEGDDYPVEPGNGGGTFGNGAGTLPDGGGGTTDGGTKVPARVCGLSEILIWTNCDAIGLAGVMVMVGPASESIGDDGSFEIVDPPNATNLRWRVSGTSRMTTLSDFPGDRFEIPSIRTSLYEDLAADTLVVPDPTLGAIFVHVTHEGQPVEGATAALAIPSAELVRYDDPAGSSQFSVGTTRAAGKVWFPNVVPGTAVAFTVTPPAEIGDPETAITVVEANTATFVTVDIP